MVCLEMGVCFIIGGRFYNRRYVIVRLSVYILYLGACLRIGGMFRIRAYVSKSGGMSRNRGYIS